ncbi:MAG TPA: hypothetical protein PKD85_07915, partial [Saprospiraceae bacterium]|nr:hypothetical protein [Saprospiraceae bacterium]
MQKIQNIFDNLASKSVDRSESKVITAQYISNPDGNIRWIWPSTCKSPYFLKFYHVQGFKANVFARIIKLIFALRLQKLAFKSTKVALSDPILMNQNEWALFTGTVGPNQKYILYKKDALVENSSFTKIALTPQSQKLINNERAAIEILGKEKEINFHFPAVIKADSNFVTLEENVSFSERINQWSTPHYLFLKTLTDVNPSQYSFEDFDQKHNISARIQSLNNSKKKLPSGIIKKLDFLHQSLFGSTVDAHLAHGDFTPWNTYSNKNGELYVYDWELYSEAYPLCFDFFHFIIQNGVLTQQKSWKSIKKEIEDKSQNFIPTNEVKKYLSLYLLVNVLNYLEIYETQSQWHTQIHWLLNTWNLALSDVLRSEINQRELIILDVFDHLHYQKYAGLKIEDQPEKISAYSDLDLLMSKPIAENLIQLLRQHPLVCKVKDNRGFAMTKLMILTNSNELLSIDCIHQLKRKNIEYMSVNEMIENSCVNTNGIKKVNLMDTIQFIGLFYGLNNASIPSRFDAYVDILKLKNQKLADLINIQFHDKKPNTNALLKEIKNQKRNKGFMSLKNTLTYVFDSLINLFYQNGMIITFSGVDGAGKSTIIENTKLEIEKKLRKKVVVIRHRPSLLPILSAWTKGKS